MRMGDRRFRTCQKEPQLQALQTSVYADTLCPGLEKESPGFPEPLPRISEVIETWCLSVVFGACGRRRSHFLAARPLDAGGLALQIAQVIQPRASNFALANDFNRADCWRVQWENAFDADAKADPTHRKGCTGRPALFGDHDAFERLQAFLYLLAFAFLQADVDAHGVTRAELGEVFAQLR